jgi:galactokinase
MMPNLLGLESASDVLTARFVEMFGARPHIFRAPGRVNLIGEHTDYNDGFVLPTAIASYTWIAAAKREDRVLEAYSGNFSEGISLSLDALAGPPRRHWSDFIRGVAARLEDDGHKLAGANLVIHGEVPLGAGLSSSASLPAECGWILWALRSGCSKNSCGTRISEPTINIYGDADSADMRNAHEKVVHLAIPRPSGLCSR